MNERIPTGISGLDEVLSGGLYQYDSYLLVGRAGTGKTITCLQWLREGVRRGERTLYVGLSEPIENIQNTLDSFGWSDDGLRFVDLYPSGELDTQPLETYNVFPPSEVERSSVWKDLLDAVREHQPTRLAIDSLTDMRFLAPDAFQFRRQIRNLVALLRKMECTTLFTFEVAEHEREAAAGLAVDGIIRLERSVSQQRVIGRRRLQVEKLRRSTFMSGYHSMEICDDGLRVYPHVVEDPGTGEEIGEPLPADIDGLDDLLKGGLERGTSTVLSGQSGTGKTVLSTLYARAAVRHGERAIIYAFEESPGAVINRCLNLGYDLAPYIADGSLRIERINPVQLYPDEFLQQLRKDVEDDERSFVVIDSLRGYKLAVSEFATPVANLHNIISFLKRNNVTVILINEIEQLAGEFLPTEAAISYVADNIILMRYGEYDGDVIRLLSCLKKRHGAFETMLRPYTLSADGFQVGDALHNMTGLLTGVPRLATNAT